MTTFGISGNLLPPLYPDSSRTKGITLDDFRAQINRFGENRPSPADLLFDSFVFVSNRVPQVNDLRGPLSALRVNAAGRFVTERFQNSGFPLVDNVGEGSRFTSARTDTIDQLVLRMQALLDKVEELRTGNAFNLLSARSSDSGALSVTAGTTAEPTSFEVNIQQVATRSVLASDVQGAGALGLIGSFRVNGVEIAVLATDTLADIMNKINRGEDVNGNGVLNKAEDVNGNGLIDTIQVSGSQYGSGLYIIEDQNGNGILDPAEDVNGNEYLDGGTKDHHVTATLQNNRLLLTSQTGQDSAISLSDPDGVLFALGFFELNAGVVIQNESQLDGLGVNLVKTGTDAKITIDDETFTSATNQFADILEGISLEVRGGEGDTERVTVQTDAGAAVNQIQSLFLRLNDALASLNDALAFAKTFAGDFELQSVREELTENSQTGIRSNESRDPAREAVDPANAIPPSLGLNSVNTAKFSTTELGITLAAQAIRDGLGAIFLNRGSELFKKLSSVGIKTETDDTIEVNRLALTRALESQPEAVLELFNHAETGILPRLQTQLESLLNENVGRLDLKSARLEALSELDTGAAESFKRAFEKLLLETTTRNLIAIV